MEFSLWTEKYRPHTFDDLMYNTTNIDILKRLTETNDLPHLLFYGPNGGGKRTLIKSTLHSLFGDHALNMKSEIKEFDATKTTKVECVINSSNYHIEVNPSDADRHDKAIINTLIKETASAKCIDENAKPFKVVVIHEVDKLSKDAQAGLRRTMEKYMTNC